MNRTIAGQLIVVIILAVIGLSFSISLKNIAPLVKISKPVTGKFSKSNSFIAYDITVSDKEDGESRYDEIEGNELFLEIHYFKQFDAAKKFQTKFTTREDRGLQAIKRSDCFNCHQVRSNFIGPSFLSISKKYQAKPGNLKLVAKHIKEGSSKIWGEATMPAHPEISQKVAESIVNWITQNVRDSTMDIQRGLKGNFLINRRLGCAIVLKATYLDHGINGLDSTRRQGSAISIIRSEQCIE